MKKTILFIALFFALLIGQAQTQISSLQKGLIFSTKLDEWGAGRDEISGTVPTKTDVYNILGKGGEGRRYLENINTSYSSLADDARYDFGTGDFTLIASFTPANITDNGKYLISKEAGGIGYGLYQEDNDIWIRFDDGTTDVSAIIGTDILVVGTKITCEVVFTRAGNAVLYLNGSASSSGTVAISTANLTLDNTGAFVVGNIEAHNQGFTGQIHFIRAFNLALTTQIANCSRPEYSVGLVTGPELVVDGGFDNASKWTLVTGWSITGSKLVGTNVINYRSAYQHNALIVNGRKYLTRYTISDYSGSGGTWIYIGNTANGTVRSSNGTFTEILTCAGTANVYAGTGYGGFNGSIDNFSVTELGCVLDLNPSGLAASTSGYWYDHTNSLTATNSGTTLVIPPASNLGAMAFNGTTSKVAYAELSNLPLGATERSFSIWINPQIRANYLSLMGYGGAATNGKIGLYLNSAGKIYGENSTAYFTATSNTAIPLNVWSNIVVTFKTGVLKYYINGVYDGTATITLNTIAGNTWVGVFTDSFYYWNGLLSNAEIYKEELQPDQIKLIYDTGF